VSVYFTVFLIAFVLLLAIGIYSLFVTKNLLRVLISVEILMKAVTLLFVAAGFITGNEESMQALVIIVIVIEVVLLVIATGIVIGAYRKNGALDTTRLNNLKG
jgi:NADH-quinone oxidoreductase subunit K